MTTLSSDLSQPLALPAALDSRSRCRCRVGTRQSGGGLIKWADEPRDARHISDWIAIKELRVARSITTYDDFCHSRVRRGSHVALVGERGTSLMLQYRSRLKRR